MESVEEFRARARTWLADNMPRIGPEGPTAAVPRDEAWPRARELQKILFDGGFAGLCYPVEYGGQGLSPEHQRAFNEESAHYDMPLIINVPSLTIVSPTILEFGTEEQKKKFLPKAISGEWIFVQLLSEPRGGSDLAGAITRVTPDGDVFRLNGSKIWSSGAYAADYGICVTRTNWDVAKHRGLSLFMVDLKAPGVEIKRIRQVTGNDEFCQEYFDDVILPSDALIGKVDDGWTVASRLLFHERAAVGGGSIYYSGTRPQGREENEEEIDFTALLENAGRLDDPAVRERVGEIEVLSKVQGQLVRRVVDGINQKAFVDQAGSMMRLYSGMLNERRSQLALEAVGPAAAEWEGDHSALGSFGLAYLMRQAGSIGGGTTEMARNIISERVLGMPREAAPDRNVPFSQVRQGPSQN